MVAIARPVCMAKASVFASVLPSCAAISAHAPNRDPRVWMQYVRIGGYSLTPANAAAVVSEAESTAAPPASR